LCFQDPFAALVVLPLLLLLLLLPLVVGWPLSVGLLDSGLMQPTVEAAVIYCSQQSLLGLQAPVPHPEEAPRQLH